MARRTRKRFEENQKPRDALGVYNESSRQMLYMEAVYPQVYALPSHGFTLTAQEESEPSKAPVTEWNAFTRQLERKDVTTSRKIVTNVEFEIACPPWTHSRVIEAANAGVQADFLLFRDATEYKDRRVEVYSPSTALKEAIRSENLKMGGLDPQSELVGKTTGATTKTIMEIWAARGEKVNDLGANPLYAVCFANPDYDGVRDEAPGEIIVGGGQLGNATDEIMSVMSSEDSQYDTPNDLSTGLAAGQKVTGLVQVGNLTFASYADNILPASATTGGILVYDGSTVDEVLVAGSPIGEALYAIVYDSENQRVIAVGKGGKIYTISRTNYLVATDRSDATVTDDMISIAVSRGTGYIATDNGNAYTFSGVTLTDITEEVVGAIEPSELNRVAYLGNEHIAFGGASGFFSESDDGGVTWRPTQINNGVGNVRAIAGQAWRIFVGIDDTLFERSALSLQAGDQVDDSLKWREFALEGNVALSGNIRDIAMLNWMNGPNVFVAVTEASEIVYLRAAVSSR
jgi:hypothetical protein